MKLTRSQLDVGAATGRWIPVLSRSQQSPSKSAGQRELATVGDSPVDVVAAMAVDALQAGDVKQLFALVIGTVTRLKASELRSEQFAVAEARRLEMQAARKRRQRNRDGTSRDLVRQSETSLDSSPPSPSPSFPTPHITPSFPPSASATPVVVEDQDERDVGDEVAARDALLARLHSDRIRQTVGQFLEHVPDEQQQGFWVAEINAWLDGLNMPGLRAQDEQDIATALAEYGRHNGKNYSPSHVRAFVVRARKDRQRLAEQDAAEPPRRGSPVDRRLAEEREEERQAQLKYKWARISARRAKGDGEDWWQRMQTEAKAAAVDVVLYGFERLDEPAA